MEICQTNQSECGLQNYLFRLRKSVFLQALITVATSGKMYSSFR